MSTDVEVGSIQKTTESATPKVTKVDLIKEVSRVAEITHKEAAVIVELILDSMVHAIERGDKVEIRGFGSFRTKQRPSRIRRNPKTGARVELPAKRIPFFKAGKELRDVLLKMVDRNSDDTKIKIEPKQARGS
jgi:integration host factor subunit beta